jgi:hypothetical protein
LEAVQHLWGATPTPTGKQSWGQGWVYWGRALAEVLVETLPCVDVEVPPGIELHWLHRRDSQRDLYFVANPQPQPIELTVGFRVSGRQPCWMDPVTGQVQRLPCYHDDGLQTRVRLTLEDSGSGFVCFEPRQEPSTPWRQLFWNGAVVEDVQALPTVISAEVQAMATAQTAGKYNPARLTLAQGSSLKPVTWRLDGNWIAWGSGTLEGVAVAGGHQRVVIGAADVPEALALDGPWQVVFDHPEGKAIFTHLSLWNEHADPEIKHFSGTATYRKGFVLDDRQLAADQACLDLGQVGWIASVTINGKKVDRSLWAPPFRLDVADLLRAGENELEIAVANPWRNRLLLEAAWPEERRKTWTTHYPKESWLVPSGLAGPVRLFFGKRIAPNEHRQAWAKPQNQRGS